MGQEFLHIRYPECGLEDKFCALGGHVSLAPRTTCSVRESACPGPKAILDGIVEALRRGFIQCRVLQGENKIEWSED